MNWPRYNRPFQCKYGSYYLCNRARFHFGIHRQGLHEEGIDPLLLREKE